MIQSAHGRPLWRPRSSSDWRETPSVRSCGGSAAKAAAGGRPVTLSWSTALLARLWQGGSPSMGARLTVRSQEQRLMVSAAIGLLCGRRTSAQRRW